MNKLSKIFLVIIILLLIIVGIMAYYLNIYIRGYYTSTRELQRVLDIVGRITTIVEEDGTVRDVIGIEEQNSSSNE